MANEMVKEVNATLRKTASNCPQEMEVLFSLVRMLQRRPPAMLTVILITLKMRRKMIIEMIP